jgi:hypothetical protein
MGLLRNEPLIRSVGISVQFVAKSLGWLKPDAGIFGLQRDFVQGVDQGKGVREQVQPFGVGWTSGRRLLDTVKTKHSHKRGHYHHTGRSFNVNSSQVDTRLSPSNSIGRCTSVLGTSLTQVCLDHTSKGTKFLVCLA